MDDYLLPDLRKLSNPWTQLKRNVKASGLKPWPRLWQNLRSTHETELFKKYPVQTVCRWIGNSPTVALNHYAQVQDKDFIEATKPARQNALQSGAAKRCMVEKSGETQNSTESLISLLISHLQEIVPEYAMVQKRLNGPYRT